MGWFVKFENRMNGGDESFFSVSEEVCKRILNGECYWVVISKYPMIKINIWKRFKNWILDKIGK